MVMLGAPMQQAGQANRAMSGAPINGGQYTQGNLTPGLYDRPALLAGQLTSGMIQNPAMAGISSMAAGGQVNPAMAGASHIASGADVGNNPYLDATYNRAARPIVQNFRDIGAPQQALDASSAGRTGGGLYAMMRNRGEENVGTALSDLSNQIYGGAYENERGRQMQALGMQGQYGQEATQNRLNALGQQAQVGQQDVNNRLAGAGLFGQGQDRAMQGIQLGQNLQNAQVNNFSTLTGVGNALQQAPWQAGTQYAGLLNSTPGISGTSTNTPNYSPSLFSSVLGGAMGGASAGLGMSGGLAGWGGLGGILGGLGGLGR